MNDQQTEIPIENPSPNPSRKPSGKASPSPLPNPDTDHFTILASMPWVFSDPQCCMRFKSEIWQNTENDEVLVTYWHSLDCEIWRYVP